MKKFILFLTSLLFVAGGLYYVYYFEGFYVDLHPNAPVEVLFSNDNEKFLSHRKNQTEKLTIKGVVIESTLPGFYFSDYKIDKETYEEYFKDISNMGANTLRVKMIMNPDFYEALLEFNEKTESPLYLIQGVGVDDYGQNNNGSLYDRKTLSSLIDLGKKAVDVVHGKANITMNSIQASGKFRNDVSPYTIGYIIGDYWFENTLAYTNHTQSRRKQYEGEYFETQKGSKDFESMMAEVMDKMVSYESRKYKNQRLISFISGPSTDPFDYKHSTRIQVDKYVEVNHEAIKPTEKLKSGYFAAYNMYPFIPDVSASLAETEKELHAFAESEEFESDSAYNGYVQLLTHYHTMPVLIANYGYSSSRGVENTLIPQLTEKQQGDMLVETYQDMINQDAQGAIISSWQDNWSLSSWNTEYAVDSLQQRLWHDVQSPENGYGLLAFDPGKEKTVSYVDGDTSEWSNEDLLSESEGLRLYQKYDSSYVYFYIEGANLESENRYYIPIDTTQKSGSQFIKNEDIHTDRKTDFLIKIDGKENSRILVQEYANSTLMEYGERVERRNRFYNPPKKDSSTFEPILMVQKKKFDPDYSPLKMTPEEKIQYNLLPTFESGKLRYGNGNPASTDYLSLADFFEGDFGIEIRIPWQLLNMSDPSDLEIHDDYYEHYGVETIRLKEMYAGIGTEGRIIMHKRELKKYNQPFYHPRLKQSYYILQKAWTE